MKLEEIAQVMIGILSKRENDKNGQNCHLLFSLRNYEENNEYEELKTNKDFSDKIAQKGDLLFRLLYPNKIIYVDEKIDGLLIPSQFCIIRVNDKQIDPIVLKWYLESKKVQEELNLKVRGSIIKSMPLANLKTTEVPDIPIETQKDMKKLIKLWEREKEISEQILQEKEILCNYYLEKMINVGEQYDKRK